MPIEGLACARRKLPHKAQQTSYLLLVNRVASNLLVSTALLSLVCIPHNHQLYGVGTGALVPRHQPDLLSDTILEIQLADWLLQNKRAESIAGDTVILSGDTVILSGDTVRLSGTHSAHLIIRVLPGR